MEKSDRIFVAGHRGMVGSALVRSLQQAGCRNLILRSHQELDLRQTDAVATFFASEKPDIVILSAARVGGIKDNSEHLAEFLYDNLQIQNNVIWQAYLNKVKTLCFLGSSCIYPRNCPQPMKEQYLLTGSLEPTNEGYAIAKIAGYKLCCYLNQQYGVNAISLMPCNLYGTNDHFDLNKSHVLSALVRRFSDAADENHQEVVLWGTGSALREFMHVDDMAAAVLFAMDRMHNPEFMNIGTGSEISIRELAEKIAAAAEFKGNIIWDHTKPDGMPRKLMDVSKLSAMGFSPRISLDEGIARTIKEYRALKASGTISR